MSKKILCIIIVVLVGSLFCVKNNSKRTEMQLENLTEKYEKVSNAAINLCQRITPDNLRDWFITDEETVFQYIDDANDYLDREDNKISDAKKTEESTSKGDIYDKDGKLLVEYGTHYSRKDMTVYFYNEVGDLTGKIEVDSDGNSCVKTYKYNSEHLCIEEIWDNKDTIKYKYNSQHQRVEEQWSDGTLIKFTNNSSGQVIKEERYVEGEWESTVEYIFDVEGSAGKIIKEVETYVDEEGKIGKYMCIYEYTSKGKLARRILMEEDGTIIEVEDM